MYGPLELEYPGQIASPDAARTGKDVKPVWAGFRGRRNSRHLVGMEFIHEQTDV
jgi:hypothetical protein